MKSTILKSQITLRHFGHLMKKLFIIMNVLFLLLPVFVAAAENFNRKPYKDEIIRAEKYLSEFKTLVSEFSQINPEGKSTSKGIIKISRPGKARFEYTSPEQIVMVINKDKMFYWDKTLEQITFADVPSTIFSVLMDNDIKFSGKINLLNIIDKESEITFVLEPAKIDEYTGNEYLSLSFAKKPFELKKITRIDSNNAITAMNLSGLQFGNDLDDSLFILNNPIPFNRKKR